LKGNKKFYKLLSNQVQRISLTFSFDCAYTEIVGEVKVMLFVYSDHKNIKTAVLILGRDSLPKAWLLTDTLGLGRLFVL